jgi:hypothetical protein
MSAIGITGYWQQFIAFRRSLIFLDDMFGGVEQSDIGFCSRLLSVGLNP